MAGLLLLAALAVALLAGPSTAAAQVAAPDALQAPAVTDRTVPELGSGLGAGIAAGPLGRAGAAPGPGDLADDPEATFSIDLGDAVQQPSNSLVILLLLTLLSLAPSLLIMLTSFTRIVIVLSLTRNALGLPTVPPNQVIVGLALFLSLFTMAPTLTELNEVALQPLLAGQVETTEALSLAQDPLRDFMTAQVGQSELALFIDASGSEAPATIDDVPLTTLIPAFILSELKAAFIIGFVIFVPFLIVDLIASSVLMSMGMMMLPPVLISLPFKLLLFVMVDGWTLVVRSLLRSFA